MKKSILFLLAFVFLTLCAGCNTIQGAAKGAAAGLSKDWQGAQGGAMKIDDWLKKHAW